LNQVEFDFDVLRADGDVDIVSLSSSDFDRTVEAAQSVENALQDTQAAFLQGTAEQRGMP
jgi:hypothetical protein